MWACLETFCTWLRRQSILNASSFWTEYKESEWAPAHTASCLQRQPDNQLPASLMIPLPGWPVPSNCEPNHLFLLKLSMPIMSQGVLMQNTRFDLPLFKFHSWERCLSIWVSLADTPFYQKPPQCPTNPISNIKKKTYTSYILTIFSKFFLNKN